MHMITYNAFNQYHIHMYWPSVDLFGTSNTESVCLNCIFYYIFYTFFIKIFRKNSPMLTKAAFI